MKNFALSLMVIAALLLGGLYAWKTHQAAHSAATAELMQQQISELQSNVETREEQTARMREQVELARADNAAKSAEAAKIREALRKSHNNQTEGTLADASGQPNAKAANPLMELFKNPEMKEMIKNQQKTALSAMVDKNYSRLFSDLHLTPEQSATLKDLILNKQMSAADIGMSMMSGDLDATNRTKLMEQVKASSDSADAQIKQYLGDANYSQFQSYEKTMAERTSVNGFKDQLGTGPTALSDGQEQQLIQAMAQEREGFKFTTDLSDKTKFTGDFATMFSEDKMNGYLQELGQLNQQYLGRAQTILSPDQYSAFEKYLNNQQALQKMGIGMAAKMFAPSKPSGN
jgi:hypothetical protein